MCYCTRTLLREKPEAASETLTREDLSFALMRIFAAGAKGAGEGYHEKVMAHDAAQRAALAERGERALRLLQEQKARADAAETRAETLEKIIEDAPHVDDCAVYSHAAHEYARNGVGINPHCDCWKDDAALAEAKEGAVVLNEAFHEKDKILEGWVGRAERAERRADAAEAKLKKAEAFEVAYNSISGNGWLQRAHALPGRLGSDVWHNAVERAERFGAAEARVKTLEKVLREIMGLLDSGYLVRDISHDHENGWAMKQIAPVMILKEAAAALKEKP
jgi:hypothetical protein